MDQNELETWLNTRPREDAILIAQRAAMTAFPFCGRVIINDWARSRQLTNTSLMRSLLISGVVRSYPTSQVMRAASFARSASTSRAASLASTASSSARAAARHAARAASYAVATALALGAKSATFSALASADAADARGGLPTRHAFWSNIEQDVAAVESGGDLLSTPLWHTDPPAAWQDSEPQALQNLTHETGDPNSFWHRWWRGAVSGQWLDWNLQREVALIPDDIWQQGPKAVLAAIAEIEARHDLLRQVTDLRQQVAALQAVVLAPGAAIAHRSHNHPPELVDLPAELVEHAASLLPPLQQAEVELAKPQPDKTVLGKLVGALTTFTGALLRYCGKTADTIVQEGAKSIAQKAGTMATVYIAVNHPEAVGRVFDGASSLAKALTHYFTTFGP